VTIRTSRPLPGFSFEVAAPVYDDVLPRMDVAVFAGFASRGPVNVPVPVEDVAQFSAVFGTDAPLAADVDTGHVVHAQLGPAVRLFFANGGRRCWIIRVARNARMNALPVPRLVAMRDRRAEALVLQAASPGSWSDDVTVSASLTSQRYGVRKWDTPTVIELEGVGELPVTVGDLLRIGARTGGPVLYAGVAEVSTPATSSTAAGRVALKARLGEMQWCDPAREPVQRSGTTRVGDSTVSVTLVRATLPDGAFTADVRLELDTSARNAPHAGSMLVVQFGGETMLFAVREVELSPPSASPAAPIVALQGDATWLRNSAPSVMPPLALLSAERLSLDVWARGGDGVVRRVGALGLAPDHARHVEQLPSDAERYGATVRTDLAAWRDALGFPAAGTGTASLCIPVGLGALPAPFLPVRAAAEASLVRDGLAPWDASLFGDQALANSASSTLLSDAAFIRYLAPVTRELVGLHCALGVEEATLICVPDAVQPGWVAVDKTSPPPPDATASDATDPRDEPDFINCGAVQGRAPFLEALGRDASGSVQLDWAAAAGTREFELQEATRRDWGDAITAFQGEAFAATIEYRPPGDYYYRVRGIGEHPTGWSNGAGVRLSGADGWRVRRPSEYRDDALLAVHRMLLRCCNARRDAMAVLSVPVHYRDDATIAHARLLAAPGARAIPLGTSVVPALGFGEGDALGFAALYHGWLAVRDDDGEVRSVAPDGVASGVIARRALARGAWLAPANESLRGVIALSRPSSPSRVQSLQDAGINVVLHAPRGFTVMCADTLSPDDDVRAINVRRLLILLRRQALRLGTTYVFEPNDDALRRMVQRGFEAMLAGLFERGAFAGDTTATAFQVRTDSSLNTSTSVDQGRFVVELRVAPARPLTFVTIRLVQTGERLTVTGA
jgi:hypothetical protein